MQGVHDTIKYHPYHNPGKHNLKEKISLTYVNTEMNQMWKLSDKDLKAAILKLLQFKIASNLKLMSKMEISAKKQKL